MQAVLIVKAHLDPPKNSSKGIQWEAVVHHLWLNPMFSQFERRKANGIQAVFKSRFNALGVKYKFIDTQGCRSKQNLSGMEGEPGMLYEENLEKSLYFI